MATKTNATLSDKLSLVPLAGRALATISFRLASAPFHSGAKGNRRLKDALFAGLRFLGDNITVAQEAWMNETNTTMKGYLGYAQQNKVEPGITELESGLKLCWIGSKDAKKVLLYFHGGGYVGGASPGHIKWIADLQKTCSKDKSFSVVMVAYTLATPTSGRYPIQLQEAAEALHWLIEKHGKKPSDVIVGGDSAGGHLCVSLISHVLHPHPGAVKIHLKEPLQSAVLISPWVSFRVDDASYRRNAHSDFLTPTALQRWSSMFRHDAAPDNYNEPIRADGPWFSGLDGVVKDLLIWTGGAEVFVDSIEKFAKTVQTAHPGAELVVEKGAAHVDPVLDIMLGYGKSEGGSLIEEWVMERI